MKPISITEQLMYNTVRIETKFGTGTGFIFDFNFDDTNIPILITNKHVVNNKTKEEVKFYLHLLGNEGNPSDNIEITLELEWYLHSSKDICFAYMKPILDEVLKQTGNTIFFTSVSDILIKNNEELAMLTALEEVVMIGYPNALWDQLNNLPVFRKGYTANHPAIDFNEKGIGIIDIAAFPGSSGSPIFIVNENSFTDKYGNLNIGKSRVIFLGVLFAGPTIEVTGEVEIQNDLRPNKISRSRIMMNIGYYVKASEILEFKQVIIDSLNS